MQVRDDEDEDDVAVPEFEWVDASVRFVDDQWHVEVEDSDEEEGRYMGHFVRCSQADAEAAAEGPDNE